MTVLDNVGYPLKVGGFARRDPRTAAREQLRIVGLAGFRGPLSDPAFRRPAAARCARPRARYGTRVLLFDEPLSNLDAKLRERMRFELIEIQSGLGIPAVYVTHDQAEAMVMSRRVIVMERGHIAQEGAPEDIYATRRAGSSPTSSAPAISSKLRSWRRARTTAGSRHHGARCLLSASATDPERRWWPWCGRRKSISPPNRTPAGTPSKAC